MAGSRRESGTRWMVTSHYGRCRGSGRSTHHHCGGNTDHWWITPNSPPGTAFSWRELPCSRLHPSGERRVSGTHCYEDLQPLQSALQCPPVASLATALQLHTPSTPVWSLFFLPGVHQGASSPTNHEHTNLHPIVSSPGHTTWNISSESLPSITATVILFSQAIPPIEIPSMTPISSPSKDKNLAICTPGPLPLWNLSPTSLPLHWLPGCSSNIPGTLLPQDLCTYYSIILEYSLLAIYIASSLRYFKSWLKGGLNKGFPDLLPKCAGFYLPPRAPQPLFMF